MQFGNVQSDITSQMLRSTALGTSCFLLVTKDIVHVSNLAEIVIFLAILFLSGADLDDLIVQVNCELINHPIGLIVLVISERKTILFNFSKPKRKKLKLTSIFELMY